MNTISCEEERYASYIDRALRTPGGHLHIGRGGFSLHFEMSRLSGYGCDIVKHLAIEAGLPVIDSRPVPIDIVAKLAVSGPMIAVNADPDPQPWHAYAYAPLAVVAAAYHRAGAETFNIPHADDHVARFDELPEGPLATVIDNWLAYVRREARS